VLLSLLILDHRISSQAISPDSQTATTNHQNLNNQPSKPHPPPTNNAFLHSLWLCLQPNLQQRTSNPPSPPHDQQRQRCCRSGGTALPSHQRAGASLNAGLLIRAATAATHRHGAPGSRCASNGSSGRMDSVASIMECIGGIGCCTFSAAVCSGRASPAGLCDGDYVGDAAAWRGCFE
jgi:hypothetical protein